MHSAVPGGRGALGLSCTDSAAGTPGQSAFPWGTGRQAGVCGALIGTREGQGKDQRQFSHLGRGVGDQGLLGSALSYTTCLGGPCLSRMCVCAVASVVSDSL